MPIFDQGYQHWTGPLSGHAWRWLAVARHGVRAVLKGRHVRMMLLAAWLPAIGLVTVLAVWGLLEQQAESVLSFLSRMLPRDVVSQPQEYRTAIWTVAYSFFFKAELACSLFLVLVVGPNLISRDLRFNALPLYFSRPLRRVDYFLGKLGVIGFFLAATVVGPAVAAYLLGVVFSLDLGVVRDTYRIVLAGVLYGLVITLSAGTLMLALSSLSRRSIYVSLAWAGFCFLTLMLSGILIGVRYDTERRQVIQEQMARWVQEHPPPPGIQMAGPYPIFRYDAPWRPGGRPGQTNMSKEDQERQRWYQQWSAAFAAFHAQAEANRFAEGHTDWRPVVSYSTNLDRLGDWLLNTDAAWVTLGRAVERPRAAFGPMANLQAGGRLPPELTRAANDRLLADRLVWQFPWYWSAGALGGLWLLSVWVLTRRVKSLDRLK
jgi:hypothetical protein